MSPTRDELLHLLKTAPPREMVSDQRYWDWKRVVDEVLERIE